MEPEAKYTLVGGSVLVLLALLVAAVAWLASASRGTDVQRYKIYFTRQSLEGLQVRSDVRMRGIRVGAVTGFSFAAQRPGTVEVVIGIDPTTPIKDSTRATVDRNLITGLATIRLQNLTEDSLPIARPAPGKADPVIAEGASQLQQFGETANELAQRADETMRRINATLSNENQAVLAETLVNLRNVTQKAEVAAARADAALVSIARSADAVGVASAGLSRDVTRLANRYDALGVEAGTALREASAAMRQVSGDVAQLCAPRREPARRRQRRAPSHEPAAARHRRCRRHGGAQVPRSAGDAVRSGRSQPGPGREPMNRRRAGLGLTLAGLLGGCGGLGSSPAHRYFVPETAPSRLAPVPLQRDAILLVAPTSAASFYDTQEIIYSRRAGERAHYQLSSWTEPPNRVLAAQLVGRVRASAAAFAARWRPISGVRGNFVCALIWSSSTTTPSPRPAGPGPHHRRAERSGQPEPAGQAPQLQRRRPGRELTTRPARCRPSVRRSASCSTTSPPGGAATAAASPPMCRSSEIFRFAMSIGRSVASCRRPRPSGQSQRKADALHHPDLRRREELRHDGRRSEGARADVRAFTRYGGDMQAARRAARRRRAQTDPQRDHGARARRRDWYAPTTRSPSRGAARRLLPDRRPESRRRGALGRRAARRRWRLDRGRRSAIGHRRRQ